MSWLDKNAGYWVWWRDASGYRADYEVCDSIEGAAREMASAVESDEMIPVGVEVVGVPGVTGYWDAGHGTPEFEALVAAEVEQLRADRKERETVERSKFSWFHVYVNPPWRDPSDSVWWSTLETEAEAEALVQEINAAFGGGGSLGRAFWRHHV